MKRRRTMMRLWLLVALMPVAAWSAKEEIADGLWYEHTWREPPPLGPDGRKGIGPPALAIYTLEVDPAHYRIEPALGQDRGAGLETVSSIGRKSGAIAAINGGFFKGNKTTGAPEHAYKIDDTWYADSATARSVLGWNKGADGLMVGRLKNDWSLMVGERELPISRVNQQRTPQSKILYTPAYSNRTMTGPGGIEIGIGDDVVKFIHTDQCNSIIPKNGYVYSIGERVSFNLAGIEVGMPASVMHECLGYEIEDPKQPLEESDWDGFDYIVNGLPILIADGQKVQSFAPEGIEKIVPRTIISGKHPRTAVGLLENGNWLFVVVDGRQARHSMGMTINELADYMLAQGCVEAINLDGGSSATMFLQGNIANRPGRSGKERGVSDAIVILPEL